MAGRAERGTWESWYIDGAAQNISVVKGMAHLQHMQKRRFSSIVEAEEKEFGMFVEEA